MDALVNLLHAHVTVFLTMQAHVSPDRLSG
jgi:hypothetical protein